jgi:hypothetical protein
MPALDAMSDHDAIRERLTRAQGLALWPFVAVHHGHLSALLADRDALEGKLAECQRIDLEANRFYRLMNGLDEDDHDKRAEQFMVAWLDGTTITPSNRTSVKAALAEHFAALIHQACGCVWRPGSEDREKGDRPFYACPYHSDLYADRDALEKERDNLRHNLSVTDDALQEETAARLAAEEARDALARDLAAARELLHGLLAGVDEDCGDGGCDDCEAWRPIRAFLAATPERSLTRDEGAGR